MLINFEKLVNQIDNFSNIYLLNETNFVVTKDLETEFRSLSYDENSFLIAPMHREPSIRLYNCYTFHIWYSKMAL